MPEETTVLISDLQAANRIIEQLQAEVADYKYKNDCLTKAIKLVCEVARLQNEIKCLAEHVEM
jgi:hypothetical protein